MWYMTFVCYQSVYRQILLWNYDYGAIVIVLIDSKLHGAWQISLTWDKENYGTLKKKKNPAHLKKHVREIVIST